MNEPPPASERKHPDVSSVEEVITFRIARLVMIMERAGGQWSERLFNLSINEWRLLALVHSHGDTRAGDISDLLLMDKSQMSRLIKSLIAKKLIRSKPDRQDARAVSLNVTPKGHVVYEEMLAAVLRSNERVLSPLEPDEVSVFNDMLDRLIRHNMELLQARLESDA